MDRDWTDEQIKEMRAQLSQAKRQGMWISAIQASMFLRLLTWWDRVSTTGWRQPSDGRLPTIADMRQRGVTAVIVSCANQCARSDRKLAFDDLFVPPGRRPLPDHTAFLDIANVCRFRCVKCGGRQVRVMPDWPRGSGVGGAYGQSRSIPLIEPKKRWSEHE